MDSLGCRFHAKRANAVARQFSSCSSGNKEPGLPAAGVAPSTTKKSLVLGARSGENREPYRFMRPAR